MQWKLLDTSESTQKTYAIIMESGDEVMEVLTEFARSQGLSTSQFTAIGAFSDAELGYFDFTIKDYRKNSVDEQTEVLSLAGDITLDKGTQKVHAHVVLGFSDASTRGGHLLHGHVSPTLEIMLTESPVYLKRAYDAASGLALISLSA